MVGAIFLKMVIFLSQLSKLVRLVFSEIMFYMMVFVMFIFSELVFARNFFVMFSEMLALLFSEMMRLPRLIFAIEMVITRGGVWY